MNQTVFHFPADHKELPPKGFFDCFPDLKTVYLSDNMREKIEEGIFPARKMLLVIPKGYEKPIMNIPKEMAVAVHFDDFSFEDDLESHDVIFVWGKNKDVRFWNEGSVCISGPVFQDPEYDSKNRWFAAICRDESSLSRENITKISDYWKDKPVPTQVAKIENDIEVILDKSMLGDMQKRIEKKRKEKIENDAINLAIDIKNSFERYLGDMTVDKIPKLKYHWYEDDAVFDLVIKHLPALELTRELGIIIVRIAK